MLDPFPAAADFSSSLAALSLGLPVVTMPSDRLAGRFAMGLYRMMNFGFHDSPQSDLIAEDAVGEAPSREASSSAPERPFAAAAAGSRESSSALVVHTAHDYLTMALRLTHQPKLRAQLVQNLLSRRQLLFAPVHAENALADWREFLHEALHNATQR